MNELYTLLVIGQNRYIDWFHDSNILSGGIKVKFKIERNGIKLLSKRFPKKHFDEAIFVILGALQDDRKAKWHTISLRNRVFKIDARRVLKKKLVGKIFHVPMRYFEGWDLDHSTNINFREGRNETG